MCMIAIGNGLLFAYIPVKLAAVGFQPWVAGAMLTAMSAGGIAGCLMTGRMVRAVGHARVFASLASLLAFSVMLIALGTDVSLWLVSRIVYGVSATGLFIVSQSWLNDAVGNALRGRVIAVFYMSYVLGLGLGSHLLTYISLDGVRAPLLTIAFITLAILPVGLTRLPPPPPPEEISIAFRSVWRISPVALVALSCVGGLTLLVQGFAPIYASAAGYAKDDVAALLLFMQLGMIVIQLPLGWLSDQIDRRWVLILATIILIAGAAAATRANGADLIWLIAIFALWAGATETLYSVATAHANDRADPQYYVSLSATLLIAWSVSGFLLPGLATALTPVLGPQAFMFVTIVVGIGFAGFVVWRVIHKDPVPDEETEPFQAISAQAPHTPELAPQSTDY
ncbi:MAG: MFS transporter [Alphaproteobacteria bacterium]|nr:MFS transporter [Alphaproteobacteria bacterium]